MIKSLSARGEEQEVQDMAIPSQNIEELYKRHNNMVYRVSFSYLKNAEDTKDAVSEIFLKLMQNKTTFKINSYSIILLYLTIKAIFTEKQGLLLNSGETGTKI